MAREYFYVDRPRDNTAKEIQRAWDDLNQILLVLARNVPTGGTTTEIIASDLVIAVEQAKRGGFQRSRFEKKDADEIYVGVGNHLHAGTSTQTVYWDSQLTFKFGSGGSNPSSHDLVADTWYNLYIHDASVVLLEKAELAAGEFIAITADPTWNDSKWGHYKVNDKCIGAFLTDGSANIRDFKHDGSNYMKYSPDITDRALTDLDTNWATEALTLPSFVTSALVMFKTYSNGTNTSATGFWRTKGDSDNGNDISICRQDLGYSSYNTTVVRTNTSQQIEIRHNVGGNHQMRLDTNGYYFPRGM